MKTIAIILAGGSGTRFGSDVPKQFLHVNRKMIIEYTIDTFQNNPNIDEIAVVCHPNYTQIILESIDKHGYDKIKKVINGGQSRFNSSLYAIRAYDDGDEKKMLFHDGVRPLITDDIIDNCIEKLNSCNAVAAGIETTDTIWKVKENVISNIPDRRTIYRAQTPQAFKYTTIKEAYSLALENENVPITDDCGVVKHFLPNEPIYTIQGDKQNIKITRQDELKLFENILKSRVN